MIWEDFGFGRNFGFGYPAEISVSVISARGHFGRSLFMVKLYMGLDFMSVFTKKYFIVVLKFMVK